jgi:peptidoglycan/xylan/chitin deacetylase (PgdA/CDA1 family)
MNSGTFVISLDFELYWGIRDHKKINDYYENLSGVSDAVNCILHIFNEFDISATWSTVGLLMANCRNEALLFSPEIKPSYQNENLSPYDYLSLEWKIEFDNFHFVKPLINKITRTPKQRIGTHTFSHFYSMESGQTLEQFEADLASAINIAGKLNLNSLVFPRNQCNESYLYLLPKYGIDSYRGNENGWLYSSAAKSEHSMLKRLGRLIDSYINISGENTTTVKDIKKTFPYNIPASRFLRPFSKKLQLIEFFKIRRIKNSMSHAAKRGEVFHLWWHPHNFGANSKENLSMLREILLHFKSLEKRYEMKSLNMESLVALLNEEKIYEQN